MSRRGNSMEGEARAPMTEAERKEVERLRKKKIGLERFEVSAFPEDKAKIKAYAKRLREANWRTKTKAKTEAIAKG